MNVDRILASGMLQPAWDLMREGQRADLLREHRPESETIAVRSERVHIRDQSPLKKGNIAFEGGWGWADLIEALNRRVFFWPGTEEKPVASGVNHFGRYRSDDCVVLVMSTAAVFEANPGPEFCPFNSGAPRWTQGRAPPRGPKLFLGADRFERTEGKVVEVTFAVAVRLPECEVVSHRRWVRD